MHNCTLVSVSTSLEVLISPLYQVWFHIVKCTAIPCFPASLANHHFHMRLKFGATFGPPVDFVTGSAPIFTPACMHIYFLAGSQTITSTKSRALSVHEMFFEVMTFGRRGKRSQRWVGHRWPQANCSAAAEVAQEFHAHNFYSHPSLLFLHFHSCQQLQRQIQRPDFNPSFA